MNTLTKQLSKIFMFSALILTSYQTNAMILIENTPYHDTRCYDPIFRDYHPNTCYHFDSYYGFWVSEEWYYHNHHHHYRHLPVHHFGPFHGKVHRHHMGRHHHR